MCDILTFYFFIILFSFHFISSLIINEFGPFVCQGERTIESRKFANDKIIKEKEHFFDKGHFEEKEATAATTKINRITLVAHYFIFSKTKQTSYLF
jgi:hypothetical protein